MPAEVQRRDEDRRMPWKNGGGVTCKVASSPAGSGLADFDWRISIAEVAGSGPFSTFDGIDRIIMLVDGPEMALTIDGVRHQLARFQPLSFDGETHTTCEITDPTTDLNIMTRRARSKARLEVVNVDAHHSCTINNDHADDAALVLVGLAGTMHVSRNDEEAVTLGTLDAASWDDPARMTVTGHGAVAVIHFQAL